MKYRRKEKVARSWWQDYAVAPMWLWLGLWLSINTGPWHLRAFPHTGLELLHAARAAFPLLALLAGTTLAQAHHGGSRRRMPVPLKLWTIYGLIALAAGFMFPAATERSSLVSPAYWALTYLSALAVVYFAQQRMPDLAATVRLNYFTWALTTALLVVLLAVARDQLFVGSGLDATGYGVITRMPTVAGMAMARSSGLARLAAVPGTVCFVLMWRRPPGWERVLWAAGCVAAGVMIYVMQSRGAMAAYAFALTFTMLFRGRRTRALAVFLLIVSGLAVMLDVVPETAVRHLLYKYDLHSVGLLTGRQRAWRKAWEFMLRSPLWGWGMQADRDLLGEHAHNAYVYAFLSSGLAGGAFFVGGLVYAWKRFREAVVHGHARTLGQETVLLQTGAVLAFFTARGIAEVSGSMFAIDYMIMLPAMSYLSLLGREARRARREQGA